MKNKHKLITVKQLIESLQTKDPDSIVVLSVDEEGNYFSSIQPEMIDDMYIDSLDIQDCAVGEVLKTENIYTKEELDEFEISSSTKVCIVYPY